MLFKDYHIFPMFIGLKTETRRTWKRVHAKTGNWYPVTHKMFYSPEGVVGEIRATSVTREPLGTITAEGAMREGGYTRDAYFEVLSEINDNSKPYVPLLKESMVYVVKFKFFLGDMVDGNGGTRQIDEYYWKWHDHMARFDIDVNSLIDSSHKGMIPDARISH